MGSNGVFESLLGLGRYSATIVDHRRYVFDQHGPGAKHLLCSRHEKDIGGSEYYRALTRPALRLDPTWDPLRSYARFQALLSET